EGLPALEAGLARDYPFLAPETVERVAKAYGTRARRWLRNARSPGDLGTQFGHGLTSAEVDYLVAVEWARTADDVLWRRTKLGLRLDADQAAALARYMAERT
ncbi:MAG TPA: glycerol-3-phosphate dehydrogenase C-terminal domain-containing protein, partial [Sphingomonas sp.]|nr:glycerol-3-phosphate dehydrogenase C-terminal domain-containing protein [Sphingomonas sp.]